MRKTELIIIGVVATAIVLSMIVVLWRKQRRRLKTPYFEKQWQVLQKLCNNKQTWPQAVIEADRLLDQVLRRLRLPGKSMGERLVAAQRLLSHNEDVWYAHNLYKKLLRDQDIKLKERDVKEALIGVRQALKDLGALQIKGQNQDKETNS